MSTTDGCYILNDQTINAVYYKGEYLFFFFFVFTDDAAGSAFALLPRVIWLPNMFEWLDLCMMCTGFLNVDGYLLLYNMFVEKFSIV